MNSKLLQRFRVLFRYKDLIKQLVQKDIKLKYRRSFLGYLWSVLNPLMVMMVMYFVFSHMFRFDIENYPAYLIVGQTLFTFMTEGTNQAISSVIGNAALLKKVYVPKYVFTLSKITSALVNLLFSLIAMAVVFIVSGVKFSIYMLFIPVVIIEVYVFCLGLGLLLAAASVFFRDIQYIYSVWITAWMYMTPIFYPIEQLSETMQKIILNFNPMSIYIVQFRTCTLGRTLPEITYVVQGFGIALVFLAVGSWYFIKKQDDFIQYI